MGGGGGNTRPMKHWSRFLNNTNRIEIPEKICFKQKEINYISGFQY